MVLVILDFDGTLIVRHTGGIYRGDALGFFGGAARLAELRRVLARLHQCATLYIVSRGLSSSVQRYLREAGLSAYFGRIYGVERAEQIAGSEPAWANIKARTLDSIRRETGARQIHFYDDTAVNVQIARAHGFADSHIVNNKNDHESLIAQLQSLARMVCRFNM